MTPPPCLTTIDGISFDHIPIVRIYLSISDDHMVCVTGDPTEDKIEALIEPLVRSGAAYFVIDASLCEPSQKRSPSGFGSLMRTVRDTGLIPGLWLKPEVIEIKSIVAEKLPELAFFQQRGKRVIERGRS